MLQRNWLTDIVIVGVAVLGSAAAQAQAPAPLPSGFGGVFGGAFGGAFSGGSGLADVLRRQDVRKELELLDDQVQKLEKLGESRRENMKQMFSGMEKTSPEERFQKMRELFQKAQQETEREIGRILLPHQMMRLRQLALQLRLRGGTAAVLNERAQELGLTAEQKQNLREKAAELDEQVQKKYAELRKQKQIELLKTLTPAQQAKWKDMVGEPFEFRRPGQPPAGGDRGKPTPRPNGR
jgi:Spy/CpxP family protein refolding chaperone